MNKLMNEMESQKELLLTYEQTLSHKDSIVANVTNAIQKQVCSMVQCQKTVVVINEIEKK